MDKFSKISKSGGNIMQGDGEGNSFIKKSRGGEVLWENDYLSIIEYEDWSIIKENDLVVCIIYLIEENSFIIRKEYIPTYKYVNGNDYHITVLSGGVKDGESYKNALLREIEEEAGIVIRPDFKIEFLKPLHISKGNTAKYFPSLITLTERDYHEVIPKGDGSHAEKVSQSVKVDVKWINSLQVSDLITEYMILKLKEYLNMN
jgi:8-oxo-dGTP pyrophosphatase MutT (NUDIX family)